MGSFNSINTSITIGKPSNGVIRYNNQYYVCDHEIAVHAFMNDPEFYLLKIKSRALKNPEYIHLLRLQRSFPKASILHLLDQPDDINNINIDYLSTKKPNTRDVGKIYSFLFNFI